MDDKKYIHKQEVDLYNHDRKYCYDKIDDHRRKKKKFPHLHTDEPEYIDKDKEYQFDRTHHFYNEFDHKFDEECYFDSRCIHDYNCYLEQKDRMEFTHNYDDNYAGEYFKEKPRPHFINDIPVDKLTTDCLTFPMITCYARNINRLTNETTNYREILDIVNRNIKFSKNGAVYTDEKLYNRDTLNFGIIDSKFGGYSQYLIEFDIWNNEPSISIGFTKIYFEDAKDCKVYIVGEDYEEYRDNMIDFEIKSVTNNTEFEQLIDSYDLNGNFNHLPGTLSGKGDHTKFQLGVYVLPFPDRVKETKLCFSVCFEYTTKHEFIDYCGCKTNKVKLHFPCEIHLTKNDINAKLNSYGDTLSGVTKGKIDSYNIKNDFPTSLVNVYKKNSNTLYDQCFTQNNIYEVFLPNGVYDFNIKCNNTKRQFRDVEITRGVQPFYSNIDFGNIYERFEDVYVILDRKQRHYQIYGKLISENDKPIQNAEIIFSQNGKMVLYTTTDEFGNYRFILDENGIYDIRVRANNFPLKIIRDFNYDRRKGFIKQLREQNKSFNTFSINVKL